MSVKQHGLKVRIYPNQAQADTIEQNIGNVRFVWNAFLGMANERYQNNPTLPALRKYDYNNLLVAMKNEHNFPFLKASESTSLQVVSESLHNAFQQFFKKKRGYPNFKSKHRTTPSYTMRCTGNNVELTESKIKLPKLGWMSARWSNHLSDFKVKRVTITRVPEGHYIASLIVESENQTFDNTGEAIGLDMGQHDLMIGSNGLTISTKRYAVYEQALADWQRKASRRARLAKARGVSLTDAKNYQQAKRMVAKYYAKIRNCRKDYLHKETTKLVKAYDIIAIEDLGVKKIMTIPSSDLTSTSKRRNNHAIANQSWRMIRTMLDYKCDWYGKTFVTVDPAYTTQDCSTCGHRCGPKNDTTIRSWVCSSCSTHHNRDVNAAINILNRGLATLKAPVTA